MHVWLLQDSSPGIFLRSARALSSPHNLWKRLQKLQTFQSKMWNMEKFTLPAMRIYRVNFMCTVFVCVCGGIFMRMMCSHTKMIIEAWLGSFYERLRNEVTSDGNRKQRGNLRNQSFYGGMYCVHVSIAFIQFDFINYKLEPGRIEAQAIFWFSSIVMSMSHEAIDSILLNSSAVQ